MKKLLTIALALVMALSLSVTAFATEQTIRPSQSPSPVDVTYTVNPSYIVTIPASVTLDGTAVEVKAEDVKVKKGEQVVVTLSGVNITDTNPNGDDTFNVKTNEGAELEYTVNIVNTNENNSTTSVAIDDAVLTVTPGTPNSGSVNLSFVAPTSVTYAGTYTGTVTFTVSVDTVDPDNTSTESDS